MNQKYSCNLHLKAESGLCKPWPCQGTCTLLERSVRTPPSEWWGCSSAATELLHRAGLRGLSWRGTQRADSVCTGICHCASPVTCCKEPEPARVLLLALTPGAGTCLGAALGCQGAGCGVIGNLPRGKSWSRTPVRPIMSQKLGSHPTKRWQSEGCNAEGQRSQMR